MTGTIAYAALVLSLGAALYGTGASVWGARTRHEGLTRSGTRAAYAVAALVTLAVVLMEYALITHDFSIHYVAQVGSRGTPLLVTIISLWSALEGSILFWMWLLALFTALVAWLYRDRWADQMPYVNATLLGIGVFFLIMLIGPSNPFAEVWPVPSDGPGPNPLLQNHPLMAIHPPAQYIGYVGFSVPFAFAVAALITGRTDDWWTRAVRRWTLVAWAFLTIAIVSGGWWAYEVLGWGGYWAWDPVENASLMPWLTGTAFLHSVMVQERRDMLRGWNVTLITATFALTILGTFLTRSGVVGSVHAFTDSLIGPLFLSFLGVVLIVSTALLLWRAPVLKRPGSLNSLFSREAAFLVGNLVFVALTFTVLLGTLFPLVVEATRGDKVSVGPPYFNAMTVPLFAALLFLMGVGPMLPWKSDSGRGVLRRIRWPAAASVVAASAAVLLGARGVWALVTYGLAAFALTAMFLEVGRGMAVLVRRGAGPVQALIRLVAANRRRYGGYIVHTGVVVLAVAVTVSWNSKTELEATLRPGEALTAGPYQVRLDDVWAEEEPHRFGVGTTLTVLSQGRPVAELAPRQNYYPTREDPIPTPAVRSSAARDLFVNLLAFENDGSSATFHVVVTPLMAWLWIGTYIMAFGAIVALWPNRVRLPSFARAGAPEREEVEAWSG
ncbi:MAG: heme lyase CcmF/NrfE family subunit [Candidatus Longimicrobiales bacterium M2_2A_002]